MQGLRTFVVLAGLAVFGCGLDEATLVDSAEDDEASAIAALGAADDYIADGVNDPRTTVAALCARGVTSTTSRALIAHRDGPDGVPGTVDDDRFDSVGEVDAIYGVGPVTLEKLRAHALSLGYGPASTGPIGTWDGVDFTAAEADATLRLVNCVSAAWLNAYGIPNATASAIVAARPIQSIGALSAISGVGPATMEKLKRWGGQVSPTTCP